MNNIIIYSGAWVLQRNKVIMEDYFIKSLFNVEGVVGVSKWPFCIYKKKCPFYFVFGFDASIQMGKGNNCNHFVYLLKKYCTLFQIQIPLVGIH